MTFAVSSPMFPSSLAGTATAVPATTTAAAAPHAVIGLLPPRPVDPCSERLTSATRISCQQAEGHAFPRCAQSIPFDESDL